MQQENDEVVAFHSVLLEIKDMMRQSGGKLSVDKVDRTPELSSCNLEELVNIRDNMLMDMKNKETSRIGKMASDSIATALGFILNNDICAARIKNDNDLASLISNEFEMWGIKFPTILEILLKIIGHVADTKQHCKPRTTDGESQSEQK